MLAQKHSKITCLSGCNIILRRLMPISFYARRVYGNSAIKTECSVSTVLKTQDFSLDARNQVSQQRLCVNCRPIKYRSLPPMPCLPVLHSHTFWQLLASINHHS